MQAQNVAGFMLPKENKLPCKVSMSQRLCPVALKGQGVEMLCLPPCLHRSHTQLIHLDAYPCFTSKEHRAERSCDFSRTSETFVISRDIIVKRASHSKKTQ